MRRCGQLPRLGSRYAGGANAGTAPREVSDLPCSADLPLPGRRSRDFEETRKVVTAPVCKIMPQEEWDESIGAGKAYVAVSEA